MFTIIEREMVKFIARRAPHNTASIKLVKSGNNVYRYMYDIVNALNAYVTGTKSATIWMDKFGDEHQYVDGVAIDWFNKEYTEEYERTLPYNEYYCSSNGTVMRFYIKK